MPSLKMAPPPGRPRRLKHRSHKLRRLPKGVAKGSAPDQKPWQLEAPLASEGESTIQAQRAPLEIQFAQKLAGNEPQTRDRAVKKLKKWLAAR